MLESYVWRCQTMLTSDLFYLVSKFVVELFFYIKAAVHCNIEEAYWIPLHYLWSNSLIRGKSNDFFLGTSILSKIVLVITSVWIILLYVIISQNTERQIEYDRSRLADWRPFVSMFCFLVTGGGCGVVSCSSSPVAHSITFWIAHFISWILRPGR